MKFFAEKAHTDKEWVWQRRHTTLFGVVMVLVSFGLTVVTLFYVILSGMDQILAFSLCMAVFLISMYGLGQILGRFAEIQWVTWIARFKGRKVTVENDNKGTQIIRVAKA